MTITHDIQDFFEEYQTGHFSKKILVEGDSWVSHYLLANLAVQIDRFSPSEYLILNLASPGDEAEEIFEAHGQQMKKLKETIGTTRWGDTFDLILLSAAGNDIVGPEISKRNFVQSVTTSPTLFGRERLTKNFFQMLETVVDGYKRFIDFRDNSLLNPETQIITHVYSYLTPRKAGTQIGPIEVGSGWIKRYLLDLGIGSLSEQSDIVNGMLDAFHDRMVLLQQASNRFFVADTRKTLQKGQQPDLDLWSDEIHPNHKGFKKLAHKIRDEAKAHGAWTI